jgi:hypothetical protein
VNDEMAAQISRGTKPFQRRGHCKKIGSSLQADLEFWYPVVYYSYIISIKLIITVN